MTPTRTRRRCGPIYDAQPDRYAQSAQVSFSHILFSTDRRGAAAEADAAQALADLQAATGPEAADLLGDATSLPSGFEKMNAVEVEAMFGPDFATSLLRLEPGRWSGPVASGYGLHLVWLSERIVWRTHCLRGRAATREG